MAKLFKFSTIEEKEWVLEVWGTKGWLLYKWGRYLTFCTLEKEKRKNKNFKKF